MKESRIRDAGIVGAGPAGIAAAVQLARHGCRPVVVERAEPGGLLRTAWRVENLPGFPAGISGPEAVGLLTTQLRRSGAELLQEEVVSLRRSDGLLVCDTATRTLFFRAVIVASGTRPRAIRDLAIPPDAMDRVFREVHELWRFSGRHIAIVGGGDAAFDYALGLAERNQVTILMRGGRARCLPLLEQRVRDSGRVCVRAQTDVTGMDRVGERGLRLVTRTVRADSERVEELEADYLVLAIGREPNDGFLSEEIRASEPELRARGELILAGDVRSGIFRQASIAAGQGTQAAMEAAAFLAARAAATAARPTEHTEHTEPAEPAESAGSGSPRNGGGAC